VQGPSGDKWSLRLEPARCVASLERVP
jgi:hypothetical protein